MEEAGVSSWSDEEGREVRGVEESDEDEEGDEEAWVGDDKWGGDDTRGNSSPLTFTRPDASRILPYVRCTLLEVLMFTTKIPA